MNINQIEQIASQVRQWAEDYQKARNNNNEYLNGMCGKASARLHSLLIKNNIPSILCNNSCHVFVCIPVDTEGNELLVDITATQFGDFPKVVIENYQSFLKSCEQKKVPTFYWYKQYAHKTSAQLNLNQICEAWPEHQIAKPEDYNV
jgi:hypothetical protein